MADATSPASVSDGSILRILDKLLTLDGEKLSYRTLDVEQIGSVYETVMGFTIETLPSASLAIRAGKNDRTPVFVDIDALTGTKGAGRAKFLKDEADRHSLSDKLGKAIAAAEGRSEVAAALRPIAMSVDRPAGPLYRPVLPSFNRLTNAVAQVATTRHVL